MESLLIEPQDSLPDIFVWMVVHEGNKKERVAYTRIPARQVVHSVIEEESGKHCAKIQTLFLSKAVKKGYLNRLIQAKLEIYIWFGLMKYKNNYTEGLPIGYQMQMAKTNKNDGKTAEENEKALKIPEFIHYQEKHEFLLRAHLFQARGLVAADDTGLSDPFVKVIFADKVATSLVVNETLNPNWDQTLQLDSIILHGKAEEFKQDPPLVIVEIFDDDDGLDSEFIGRTVAKPSVKMSDDIYAGPDYPAKLDWFQVYSGKNRAGEVLASFELIQVPFDECEVDGTLWNTWCESNDEINKRQNNPPSLLEDIRTIEQHGKTMEIVNVPRGIRPILIKHRIEVLFWGLRDLKKINLMTEVKDPRVVVEIAGKTIQSSTIYNMKTCPNFDEDDNVKTLEDVELPDYWYWTPPISIKVIGNKQFGAEVLVGTHVCHNIQKFMYPKNVEERSLGVVGNSPGTELGESVYSTFESNVIKLN